VKRIGQRTKVSRKIKSHTSVWTTAIRSFGVSLATVAY